MKLILTRLSASNRIKPVDLSTRAALVKRVAPYLPEGAVVPQSWEELSLTTRLQVEMGDPEAAAVFKGVMPAELEAKVLAGTWSSDVPAPRDLAAEREGAIQDALAGLPAAKTPEELNAELQARIADHEQARRNSAVMATGRWGA